MTEVILSTYEPLPKQLEFHKCKAKYRCFIGGFGAGKTLCGVWEAIQLCVDEPGNIILIARKTYQELTDTTWNTLLEVIPEELVYQYYRKQLRLVLRNGSQIIGRSLDDPKKYASLNLGAFYIDEGMEATEQDFLTLCGRLRLDRVKHHCGYITTNPPTIDHWIYEYFVKRNDPNYVLIRSSTYDNSYLPKDYVENLAKEYPDSWRKRYLEGEFGFVLQGDPVFPSFKESLHVDPEIRFNPFKPVIRGWDFGWHHPAVVFLQIQDNNIIILDEYMGNKIYLHDFVKQIIQYSNQQFPNASFMDYCDIAGKQKKDTSTMTSIEILISYGIRPLYKFSEVAEGIEIINKLLSTLTPEGKPMLRFHPKCQHLINAFNGGYCYQKKENKVEPVPYKDGFYEHVVDALRYAIINLYTNTSEQKRKFSELKIQQLYY